MHNGDLAVAMSRKHGVRSQPVYHAVLTGARFLSLVANMSTIQNPLPVRGSGTILVAPHSSARTCTPDTHTQHRRRDDQTHNINLSSTVVVLDEAKTQLTISTSAHHHTIPMGAVRATGKDTLQGNFTRYLPLDCTLV